jgi:hypothetical protein
MFASGSALRATLWPEWALSRLGQTWPKMEGPLPRSEQEKPTSVWPASCQYSAMARLSKKPPLVLPGAGVPLRPRPCRPQTGREDNGENRGLPRHSK